MKKVVAIPGRFQKQATGPAHVVPDMDKVTSRDKLNITTCDLCTGVVVPLFIMTWLLQCQSRGSKEPGTSILVTSDR